MTSTFMGIEIGKRSVMAHSQSINTVGHNLANAETEGYSRQRVEVVTSDPIYSPALNRENTPGQLGQGVLVSQVKRYEDLLLEGRIVEKTSDYGYWSSREKWLNRAQSLFNELSTSSMRESMDQFFNSWNELAHSPENLEFRHKVVSDAQSLMDRMNGTFNMFNNMRNDINTEIVDTVRKVNELTRNIASLSEQIVQSEALGDNPNDLKDRRDQLTRDLSELINVSVEYRDQDEYSLTIDGKTIVQGKQFLLLRAIEDPQNNGLAKIIWDKDGTEFKTSAGGLSALVQLRDKDIREQIQKLDTLAVSFMDQVNEIHAKGFDLEGNSGRLFFQEFDYVNNVRGSFDRGGTGEFDSTLLFRVSGNNRLNGQQQIGIEGVLRFNAANAQGVVEIAYNSTDTVDQLIDRINKSGSEVLAALNHEGRLTLRASAASDPSNPDFVIRHIEDSGEFLVGYAALLNQSGEAGAFDWDWANTGGEDALIRLAMNETQIQVTPVRNPSGWIRVNEELVQDVTRIAAATGRLGASAGSKNGSVATAISELNNQGPMVGRIKGYREYFGSMIADIGAQTRRAIDTAASEVLNLDNLTNEKLSLTSVNIDEELTDMLRFQHGYSAASRFITEVDKMLDLIINRMGV